MISIFAQSGWVRPWPLAICQDIEALARINSYSYNLSSEEFRGYVLRRTGIIIRHDDRSLVVDGMSDGEFRASDEARISARGYRFTESEIAGNLDTRRIRKAMIQDCWELFSAA